MTWTSHAYHVAKDFQTLGAASLAFAAAGLTFYAQRWVAERQAAVTLEVSNNQIAEQKRKDDEKAAQFKTAFRIALKQACTRVAVEMKALSGSAEIVLSVWSIDGQDYLSIDPKTVAWTRFKNLGPYSNSQAIFSMPFSELAQADQGAQAALLAILDRCNLVDKAKEEVMSNLSAHGVILKIFVEAVRSYASDGEKMAHAFQNRLSNAEDLGEYPVTY